MSDLKSEILNEILTSQQSDVELSQWRSFNYYGFDMSAFCEDMTPGNVSSCLDVRESQILFIGKNSSGGYTTLRGLQTPEGWICNSILESSDKKYVKWMRKVLKKKYGNFKVLDIIGTPYYLFNIDGKPQFFTLKGEPLPFEQMSSSIKSRFDKMR